MGWHTAVIGSERNTDYKVKRSDFIALKATQKLNELDDCQFERRGRFQQPLVWAAVGPISSDS